MICGPHKRRYLENREQDSPVKLEIYSEIRTSGISLSKLSFLLNFKVRYKLDGTVTPAQTSLFSLILKKY